MFECKLNKVPESVTWLKDGEPLSEDDPRVKFVNDGKKQFLIIENAKLSDIGNYTIKVNDAESSGSLKVKGICYISVFLKKLCLNSNFNKILEDPIDFIRKLNESYTATEKETIEFECEVNKDNVKCVWKRYGKEIVPNERTKIEVKGRVQRLILSNLTLDDKQNITCVALQKGDEVASTSGRLNVNGKSQI